MPDQHQLTDEEIEQTYEYQERAAILEYEAGYSRFDAELMARHWYQHHTTTGKSDNDPKRRSASHPE